MPPTCAHVKNTRCHTRSGHKTIGGRHCTHGTNGGANVGQHDATKDVILTRLKQHGRRVCELHQTLSRHIPGNCQVELMKMDRSIPNTPLTPHAAYIPEPDALSSLEGCELQCSSDANTVLQNAPPMGRRPVDQLQHAIP